MKRYFKHEADAIDETGPGTAYFEFDGRWATRQVQIYGDRLLCSLDGTDQELGMLLCDLALEDLEFEPHHEISGAEFEQIWSEADLRWREQRTDTQLRGMGPRR